MESFFGSPWDFGTGFAAPMTTSGASFQPTMPQLELPEMFANGMAAAGIRPQQFFANPQAAVQAIQPPAASPASSAGVWDPTPVDTPGGAAVPLPNRPAANVQTDAPAMQAQAGGVPAEAKAAKELTMGEKLQAALKGIQKPTAPPIQKVDTPRAELPRPSTAIKTGDLLAMLMALQPQAASGGLKLPSTLGGALRGG